jgi:hypothetical protein
VERDAEPRLLPLGARNAFTAAGSSAAFRSSATTSRPVCSKRFSAGATGAWALRSRAAWRAGARFDSWSDWLKPGLWWDAFRQSAIDVDAIAHQPYALDDSLPWDPITIRQGRDYLRHEQVKAIAQLAEGQCGQVETK